jgi:hypothetical protein
MLLDYQNVFLEAALSTAGAGTYLGTGSYDNWGGQTALPLDALGNTVNIDPGTAHGRNRQLLLQVTVAVTSAGAATVQFEVVMSDDAAGQTNLTVLLQTAAIAKATLVAGYIIPLPALPTAVTQRYIGIQYVVGTAALTGGSIVAAIVSEVQTAIPQL